MPRRLTGALAAVVLTIGVAGCGSPVTSPSPSPTQAAQTPQPPSASPTPTPPPEEVYAAIKERVIEIRGVEPKKDIDPQVIDEADLKTRVEKLFNDENPAPVVKANERLLKGLKLIPDDASLTKMYLDLQSSQIAGFYDSDAKELFVVSRSGTLGPTERVTFAHEFTHALQDQTFDLNTFDLEVLDQGDRGLARLSLIEGDATAVMTVWAQENLSLVELLQLSQEASDPKALEILNGLPPVIREGALFPYDAGLKFVLRVQSTGGEPAVDDAFHDPPASTEQILHFEKYEDREKPVAVAIDEGIVGRLGNGWKQTLQDTLGEFQLGLWLRLGTDQQGLAQQAAAGWGGDRVALYEGSNDRWAILMKTAWDSEQDALEFRDAAAATIGASDSIGAANLDGETVRIMIGSDDAAREELAAALE